MESLQESALRSSLSWSCSGFLLGSFWANSSKIFFPKFPRNAFWDSSRSSFWDICWESIRSFFQDSSKTSFWHFSFTNMTRNSFWNCYRKISEISSSRRCFFGILQQLLLEFVQDFVLDFFRELQLDSVHDPLWDLFGISFWVSSFLWILQ